MERRVVHVIDGSGYIFRAYYAIRALATSSGEPTNATYGFATMIEKALREEGPELIAIAFDAGGRNFRHDLFPEYKANRAPPPEDLIQQIPRVHEVAEAFCLKTFVVPGVEADDVIATLTRMARERGYDVDLITGDKDLMQLVDDHVRVYEPMRNLHFGPAEVLEKFGVPPWRIADALALAGDTSDNIPGVRGVGLKTAAKLLTEHGDLETVLQAAASHLIKGKVGERLLADASAARLSRRLVTLDDHVDLGVEIEALRYPGPDVRRLTALYSLLEFRRPPSISSENENEGDGDSDGEGEGEGDGQGGGERGGQGETKKGSGSVEASTTRLEAIRRGESRIVTSPEALSALVEALRSARRVALALELSSSRIVDADIIGLALAIEDGPTAYVPVRHEDESAGALLPWRAVLDGLRPMLESMEIEKLGDDLKTAVELFMREGARLTPLTFDSTLGSYLLEPDEVSHGYASAARRFLLHEVIDRTSTLRVERAKIGLAKLPIERAAEIACERAEVALGVRGPIERELASADLLNVLRDLELPLIPVLARMELAGVRIDVSRLESMSVLFRRELERLEAACFEAAGGEFNIGSPKQLQKILFDDLKLKIIKRTKTGPSTDHEVLEALAAEHPLPQLVLEHRQVQKLQSTYVEALPKMVSKSTGRVHTVLSQTSAATGRLASNDPNLQNIPIRSELGRELRRVFIADPGHLLISVDYSQIELRVLAHFSRDEVLTQAFLDNADVHTRTASVLFGVPPDRVSREQRTQAKAVNFGVLYGMGAVRLARELKIPRRVATEFIESYYVRQPGVRKFIDTTLEEARSTGMVRTLLGRRRKLADIQSKNRGVRAAAERVAINTPIQGSAADLMKMAMIRVDAVLEESFPRARLLLQVHDELLLEAQKGEAEDVAAMVKREMERVFPLDVPLTANASVGRTWDDAH